MIDRAASLTEAPQSFLECCPRLFLGELFRVQRNSGFARINGIARGMIRQCFQEIDDLERGDFGIYAEDDYRRRLLRAQISFAESGRVRAAIEETLEQLGFDLSDVRYEKPTLRAILSNNLYGPTLYPIHRDTWWAHSQSQINFWFSLFDLSTSRSFGIYLDYFATPIDNSSSEMDYPIWRKSYLEGTNLARNVQPAATTRPQGEPTRFELKASEVLAFSAAHLHETLSNATEMNRFSVDFRVLCGEHERLGLRAPNVDNAAIGSYSEEFLIPSISPGSFA